MQKLHNQNNTLSTERKYQGPCDANFSDFTFTIIPGKQIPNIQHSHRYGPSLYAAVLTFELCSPTSTAYNKDQKVIQVP